MPRKVPLIEMHIRDIAVFLGEVVELGDAKRDGVLNVAIAETPRGADIIEAGKLAVQKLGHYARDHPCRKGLDLDSMRKGLNYLEQRVVEPARAIGTKPLIGRYRVQITF